MKTNRDKNSMQTKVPSNMLQAKIVPCKEEKNNKQLQTETYSKKLLY